MGNPTDRQSIDFVKFFSIILVLLMISCSSKHDAREVPPPPSSIELVEPNAGQGFESEEKVQCVMKLTGPPGEQIGATVSVGIWKGENHSITKFGQVIDEANPSGIYELRATLTAPKEPGRYIVRASAQRVGEDDKIKRIESNEVEIDVQ